DRKDAVVVGRGRPTPDQLAASLGQLLGVEAEVSAQGWAPYAEACQRLGVPCRDAGTQEGVNPLGGMDRLRRQLYGWLGGFRWSRDMVGGQAPSPEGLLRSPTGTRSHIVT
ncbi:MAG TPA: hypothetical protein VD902_01820, partial [Symbiobacteriaceae bacterium]|nr:hypothetical protein [Symbiobacteriaceae bacterium]